MLGLFEAAESSTKVGLIDVEGAVSFASLHALRNGILSRLEASGHRTVALYGGHGRYVYSAIIAALSGTQRLVFLDPATDLSQSASTLQVLGITAILNAVSADAPQLPSSVEWIDLKEIAPLATLPDVKASMRCKDYVIFTSGSTGEAKAIVQQMDALQQHIANYVGYVGIEAGQRVLQLASAAWDAGLMDIFASLTTSATLCSFNPKTHDFAFIDGLIRQNDIDVLHFTVPYCRAFFREVLEPYPHPKRLVIGGEIIHASDIELFNQHFTPGSVLFNAYGPTECTTALYSRLEQGRELSTPTWALDCEVGHVQVLLDRLPDDADGDGVAELVIDSALIARRMNLLSGVVEPLTEPRLHLSERACYASGDLAIRDEHGALRLLGRKDSVVKINGQKVSLVQVESEIKATGLAKDVCVITRPRDGVQTLVAFVIASDPQLTPMHLRQMLSQRLERHRVPSQVFLLERFALNKNNKIDRQALGFLADRDEPVSVASSTHDSLLIQLVGKVLKADVVDPELSFFDNGGDSLRALQVVAGLKRKGVTLDLEVLISDSPVGQLITTDSPQERSAQPSALVSTAPAFLPNRRFLENRGIVDLDQWHQTLILSAPGTMSQALLRQALLAVIQRHFKELPVNDLGLLPSTQSLMQAAAVVGGSLSAQRQAIISYGIRADASDWQLIIACHQFHVDRYSWMLLVAELNECLAQGADNLRQWRPATDFRVWVEQYNKAHASADTSGYWRSLPWEVCTPIFQGIALAPFPRREAFHAAQVLLGTGGESGMNEISQRLLAAIISAVARMTDNPTQKVHVLDHGRALDKHGAELNSVFGWLTLIYPMVLRINSLQIDEVAADIKTYMQETQAIAHTFGNEFFGLVEAQRLSGVYDCDYSYNFLGELQADTGGQVSVHPSSMELMHGSASHHLEFTGYVSEGQLFLKIDHDPELINTEQVEMLSQQILALWHQAEVRHD